MNLNKAIIIGNLTQDPEVRTTPTGQSVASFTIATNRVWNNPQGQKQEQAEYHNVVAWGRLAEIVGQFLGKGRLAMVEGRIQTRSWDDQAGNKKYRTEIIAENIQLGPRGAGTPAGQNNNSAAPRQNQDSVANSAPADIDDEIKIEDIPF
jgi:single-strand DNA-binding protein